MSYDLFAEFGNNLIIPPNSKDSFKRQKETFNRYTARTAVEKDSAKDKAKDLTGNWGADIYVCPGDIKPFLSRSISVKVKWTTTTPFFSRSNSEFSAIDNPIERDSLSGKPVLHGSGMKGLLRSVMYEKDINITTKLFGNDRLDDKNISAGRMVFGDVIFDKAGSDIFAPHDRKYGVVDHPVTFEVVPSETKAEWGFIIFEYKRNEIEIKKSLRLLLESLYELLVYYGMSAKRSSNYGLAENIKLEFKVGSSIKLNSDYTEKKEFSKPEPEKPKVSALPVWHEALVKDNKMICQQSEAVKILSEYQAEKENKNSPKQKANLEKKWSKKALKLYDECKKIIEVLANSEPDKIKEQTETYNLWLKEKNDWDKDGWKNSPDSIYKFDSIDKALSVVQNMEVI